MSLTSRDVARRDVMTSSNLTRRTAMTLLHQELARAHQAQRQLEGARARRVHALVAQRRLQRQDRRAQRAARRAELVLAVADFRG